MFICYNLPRTHNIINIIKEVDIEVNRSWEYTTKLLSLQSTTFICGVAGHIDTLGKNIC